MSYCLAYMTAASVEEAKTIGRALVEERLAACVNVVPGMVSVYRWEGALEEAEEAVLIAKTRVALFEALTETGRGAARLRQPLRRPARHRGGPAALPRLDRRGDGLSVGRRRTRLRSPCAPGL